MRRTLLLALALGAAWAAVAAASGGGPSPGLDFGNGIVAPGGKLRYSAVSDGRTTVLESVVIGTGRIRGLTFFKGMFGIPYVTFAGEGHVRDAEHAFEEGQAPDPARADDHRLEHGRAAVGNRRVAELSAGSHDAVPEVEARRRAASARRGNRRPGRPQSQCE